MIERPAAYEEVYGDVGRSSVPSGAPLGQEPNGRPSEDRTGDPDARVVELIPASSVKIEQTRWALAALVPLAGVTLLVGQEGSGKTTIAADIVARATRGQLAGDLEGEPVGVVYATAEDSWARTLAPRLKGAGADLERVHFVAVDGMAGGLKVPEDLAMLEKQMRLHGSRVLVLDPLGAHLDERLDTHRDASVRRALAPLAARMEAIDAAAIGIMHWSKAPTVNALDRVNGSRAFTAAARSMLAVAEHPDDETAKVLVLAKSNLGPVDVPALKYRIEGREVDDGTGNPVATSGVVWLGEAAGVTKFDIFRAQDPEEHAMTRDTEAALRDVLSEGPLDRAAVKKSLRDSGFDVSDKTLQRMCTRLGIERRKSGFGGAVRLELPLRGGRDAETPVQHVQHVQHGGDQEVCSSHSGHSGHSGHAGQTPREMSGMDVTENGHLVLRTQVQDSPSAEPCRNCGRQTTDRDTSGLCAACSRGQLRAVAAAVESDERPEPLRASTPSRCRGCGRTSSEWYPHPEHEWVCGECWDTSRLAGAVEL